MGDTGLEPVTSALSRRRGADLRRPTRLAPRVLGVLGQPRRLDGTLPVIVCGKRVERHVNSPRPSQNHFPAGVSWFYAGVASDRRSTPTRARWSSRAPTVRCVPTARTPTRPHERLRLLSRASDGAGSSRRAGSGSRMRAVPGIDSQGRCSASSPATSAPHRDRSVLSRRRR